MKWMIRAIGVVATVLGAALFFWLLFYSESVGQSLLSRRVTLFDVEVAAALPALLALSLIVLGLIGAFADRGKRGGAWPGANRSHNDR